MGYANANASMAITTGNKSEIAQGYCTLYGDMAGGYARSATSTRWGVRHGRTVQPAAQSKGSPPVSESTMTKPPSAELAPDQTDEDTRSYALLDDVLRNHIEGGLNADDLVEHGFDEAVVVDVLRRLERNEHKRWQMPRSARLSACVGQGWRRPRFESRLASLRLTAVPSRSGCGRKRCALGHHQRC